MDLKGFHLRRLALRPRIVGLVVAMLVVVIGASWAVFRWVQNDAVTSLGITYVEKQALYSRERTLHPLMRELALAQKLGDSSVVKAWAEDEDDAGLRYAALRELDDYRRAFADQSFFFVVAASGHYYFNDYAMTYTGNELRYTLDAANPNDDWYFATLAADEPYSLNVNYDDVLRVTKVWINVTVRDGERLVGLTGTGIDLSEFLNEVVASDQAGVVNMFVDEDGALQAHNEVDLIDFHSITKDPLEQKTIFQLVDSDADRETLLRAMTRLGDGEDGMVETAFVHSQGDEYLVGMSYLKEIGWYSITLLDTGTVVGSSRFLPFALIIFVALLVFTLALLFVLDRVLFRRVLRLDNWVREFTRGTPLEPPPTRRADEMGRLEEGFRLMAQTVRQNTAKLESTVAVTTQELSEKEQGLLEAMEEIRALTGLLPICMYCKKIRDESSGTWNPLEEYISQRSEARFSHGLCPECESHYHGDMGSRDGEATK